jgi:hypothetical protein
MKHAKLYAQNQAQDLLNSKLLNIKKAYEEEYGKLAR